MSDAINPPYYQRGAIQVIEIIELFQLSFCLGNAIKYILRAGVKDPSKFVEDMNKALWYLNRERDPRYRKPDIMYIRIPEREVNELLKTIFESYTLKSNLLEAAVTRILVRNQFSGARMISAIPDLDSAKLYIEKFMEKYK